MATRTVHAGGANVDPILLRKGLPMNNYIDEPDVPSLVAFIAMVALWGFLSCSAVLHLAALS